MPDFHFRKAGSAKDNAAALARDALNVLHLSLADVRVVSIDIDGNDGPVVRGLLAAGLVPTFSLSSITANFRREWNLKCPMTRGTARNVMIIRASRCSGGQAFFRTISWSHATRKRGQRFLRQKCARALLFRCTGKDRRAISPRPRPSLSALRRGNVPKNRPIFGDT